MQPYSRDEATGSRLRVYNTPEVQRAAAANYWARGADGLYTWFMNWPLGDAERRMLTELGDPDLIRHGTKRYVLRRRSKEASELGYDAALPVQIPAANPARTYPIRFHIADDLVKAKPRRVLLRMLVTNLVTADRFNVRLNGQSLAGEPAVREFGNRITPYEGQWLEISLRQYRPRAGENTLEVSLDRRAPRLEGGVTVEEVEIVIDYGTYA